MNSSLRLSSLLSRWACRLRVSSPLPKRPPPVRLGLEELERRTVPSTVVEEVKAINPGADSQIAGSSNISSAPSTVVAANFNGTLIFSANDGVHGLALWKSDGTAAGTVLLKDINPNASGFAPDFTVVGSTLYFFAAAAGQNESLWKTDGTTAGTVLVKDLSGSNPFDLINFNGTLFFSQAILGAAAVLTKSDGTPAGTVGVATFSRFNGVPQNKTVVGNTLFFVEGFQLWMSDGTSAGTMAVNGGPTHVDPDLTAVGNSVIFTTTDPTNGTVLWKADASGAAPTRLKQFASGSPAFAGGLVNVNGTLFFAANDGIIGSELWKTDGTGAGTILVKDINPGADSSFPFNLTAVGNTLFFTAADGTHGRQLWKSDGTAAGTVLVKQINPSTAIASTPNLLNLTAFGRTLFLAADDGTHGSELWQSDGTADGTFLVQDILPGAAGSNPGPLIRVGNRLFFGANDTATSRQLWSAQIMGGGFDKLGAYRSGDGSWSLDSDGTPGFNPATDQVFLHFSPPGVLGVTGDSLSGLREGDQGYFSPPGVLAVAGDWTGSGFASVGDFRNGNWHLDLAGTGAAPGPSETFQFGQPGDLPVVGDWTGSGKDEIGVVRATSAGTLEWVLDTSGTGGYTSGDRVFVYGADGDIPVVGDWTGTGRDEIGVVRHTAGGLVWVLNTGGTGVYTSGDAVFHFGLQGDLPVVGDWNGSGTSKVGVYRPATAFGAPNTAVFSLDFSGQFMFVTGQSQVFLFGLITDEFVTGNWRKTPPLQPAQFAANGVGPGAAALTQAALAPVVQQAIADWAATGADVSKLAKVSVRIGLLTGALIGWTDANGITLSADAAGWGWYTDASPGSNDLFAVPGPDGIHAAPGSAADGKLDLLTVVEHELGHELGLSDLDPGAYPDDLMAATLAAGVRRAV